jgi:CRP-like cAMP-binding protein
MTTLTENISHIVSLTEYEAEAIDNAFIPLEVQKGGMWIEQGKVCNHIAYVVSGKLRNFYIDSSGNEVTCYFVLPDSFVSSFTSYLTNTPAMENISALENTCLRIISKENLEELSTAIPKLHIFRRINAENLFITLERRISMLQSQSAIERYERMLKENPDIILSVPLQYTASFLGITPQHLSRLRKELQK